MSGIVALTVAGSLRTLFVQKKLNKINECLFFSAAVAYGQSNLVQAIWKCFVQFIAQLFYICAFRP